LVFVFFFGLFFGGAIARPTMLMYTVHNTQLSCTIPLPETFAIPLTKTEILK
jgi:hypothetical protein